MSIEGQREVRCIPKRRHTHGEGDVEVEARAGMPAAPRGCKRHRSILSRVFRGSMALLTL